MNKSSNTLCAVCGSHVERYEPELGTDPICPKCWEYLMHRTYGGAEA